MMPLDTYLNLCTQVYDISKPSPPKDEYEFYRSYAASANGRILEPMCGTGRFLLPLITEGFDVVGFDASQHMLDALHFKAKLKNLKVNVWKNFIEDIQAEEKYRLIFIPSGSFNLIIDIQKAKDVLKKLYDQLSDDGVLVFEGITNHWKATQVNVWTGDAWYRNDGKILLSNFLTLPDKNNIRHSIGRYELVDGNIISQTEIEDFKVRLYDMDELTIMLRDIGFTDVKMLKAYDCNTQPNNNDEVVIYECRK
jgi:SAM-dependent methyltransferase